MYVAKTKVLISCVFTGQLICSFVFAYAKRRFSHDLARMFVNPEEELRCVFDDNSKIILLISS